MLATGFEFDMSMEVDLDEIKEFAHQDLASLLIENTTNFGVAAFCLQAVLDAIDKAELEVEDND